MGTSFKLVYRVFVDYFPMYDKFRAVTMIMIIAQFSIALFAVMALNKFIKDDNKLLKGKKLKNSFYIIGGITLLFALVPSYFLDFISPTEKDNLLRGQNISDLSNAISSRQDVLQSDAWRSFMFILFAASFLYMYVKNIITKKYVILLVGTLVILDMWSINKRYLNKDSFVDEFTYNVVKDNEDLKIIENNKNRERVYDFTDSPFSSAMASYFHHSIGGYSAAKIKRYQEIYENYLSRQPIIKSFKDTIIMVPKKDGSMKPKEFLWPTKAQVNVLQMLNCGWIKSIPSFTTSQFMSQFEIPYQPMGNARFVEKISIVNNADQEFKEIETFNPLTTAIIDKKFSINQSDFNYDSSSKIKLDIKNYKPNHLIYNIDKPSAFNQLAVFSEVYYEKGWNAYIDGKIVPHFRANYILRAMIVPAGTKKIEFKFEPTSFSNGENIALASSIILLLLLAYVSFKEIKSE